MQGGVERKPEMGGKEGESGYGITCLLAHSLRRKTKRRVRVSLEKIIPGNLERNFLKYQVRISATVEGSALRISPRTVSSLAASLSPGTICMASNEGILTPAVSGLGSGPARGVQVTGSGLDAEERSVRSCRLSPRTNSPLALTPSAGQ